MRQLAEDMPKSGRLKKISVDLRHVFLRVLTSIFLIVFVNILLTAQSSASERFLWDYQLGVRLGVLGVGVELSKAVTPGSVIRLNWQAVDYQTVQSDVGISFDETLTLEGYGVYWDWHPWYNSFRATMGLVANGNKVDGFRLNEQTLTINGNTYQPSELSGLAYDADFRGVSVYFGLGWSLVPGHYKKWTFTVDSGLFLQRRLQLDLVALNQASSNDSQLAVDLSILEGALSKSLDDLWVLPSIMFGLMRTF